MSPPKLHHELHTAPRPPTSVLNDETTPTILCNIEKLGQRLLKKLPCSTDGQRNPFWAIPTPCQWVLFPLANTPWRTQTANVFVSSPWPHTPEVLTVAQLWGHLEEVIVLQVQCSQLVQPLQLHGVDGSHLVVAEQDVLQGWQVVQDTGKHLKSS